MFKLFTMFSPSMSTGDSDEAASEGGATVSTNRSRDSGASRDSVDGGAKGRDRSSSLRPAGVASGGGPVEAVNALAKSSSTPHIAGGENGHSQTSTEEYSTGSAKSP